MKKFVLALAIFGFVAFGVISIQTVVASSMSVEMVNFDKDPKKDEKKAVEAKDSKAEMKSGKDCCAKDKASSCKDKSTTASADCCATTKSSCASACPDKK
ncbi:MAG: hypothetical protein K0B37_18195 [Bacteroidales bacterium]|nr:hypothetical protein [Bacteroidales bacterium]